jgi:hypothetical protein
VKTALLAAALMISSSANAQSFGDAQEAATIMASVTVCKTVVSDEQKRGLYGAILSVSRTPHMVTYEINEQVEALNQLSASDRAAMCLAIGDRVKALLPEGGKLQ